jgi:hypothetical protein
MVGRGGRAVAAADGDGGMAVGAPQGITVHSQRMQRSLPVKQGRTARPEGATTSGEKRTLPLADETGLRVLTVDHSHQSTLKASTDGRDRNFMVPHYNFLNLTTSIYF